MDFDVQAEQGGRHESEADSSAYVRNTGLNLINVADRVLVAIAWGPLFTPANIISIVTLG